MTFDLCTFLHLLMQGSAGLPQCPSSTAINVNQNRGRFIQQEEVLALQLQLLIQTRFNGSTGALVIVTILTANISTILLTLFCFMSHCPLPLVPVTAATASSLPGAPSASRRRSPQKRDQRGDWKAIRQTFRATAAEDAVSPTTSSGLARSLYIYTQDTKESLARKRPTKQTGRHRYMIRENTYYSSLHDE